jgi:hypothetical protein
MIAMSLFEVIPQVLLSPYVIGAALFFIAYGSIISSVASKRERAHKSAPKKPGRIKKPAPDKPGLAKNEDTSELGLD